MFGRSAATAASLAACMVTKLRIASAEWDANWDRLTTTSEQSEPRTANRYIVLVRHGQYQAGDDDDVDRTLTDLGKTQATATGARLKQLLDAKYLPPVDKVMSSTMIRARQTADLIIPQLGVQQYRKCNMIREGACYRPDPPISQERWDVSDVDFYRDSGRIEAAFRNYVHRADPKSEQSSTTVLVCHGNVIRYFVCRALQLDPAAWLRYSVANGSVTVLRVSPAGAVSCLTVGDAGFMDARDITFN